MLKKIVSISKLTFNGLVEEFKRFRVPNYQRGYGWKETHWRDWLQTITELIEFNKEERGPGMIEFVGDIILKKTKDKEETCEIIDGQQRLITVSIFLSVIYKKLSDSDWKEKKTGIRNFLFYDPNQGTTRLTLNNEADKKNYERALLRNVLDKEIEREEDEEDLKESWINEAEKWFEQEIIKNDPTTPEEICEYINNKLYFSLIIFSEETEPWDVFLALNNTGLNLNASDLVKTLLVSKIDLKNTQKISDQWDKEIVGRITGSEPKKINTQMPKFLVDFWWAKFGKRGNTQDKRGVTVSKSNLYRVLKVKLEEYDQKDKPQKLKRDLFNEIKKYAKVYEKIIYPIKFKEWWEKNYSPEMFHIIYDINILKFEQLFPLILALHIKENENEEEKFGKENKVITRELRKLLIYMFRAITLKEDYPRDISNKITYQLIKKVKAGQSLFEFEEDNEKYKDYEGAVKQVNDELGEELDEKIKKRDEEIKTVTDKLKNPNLPKKEREELEEKLALLISNQDGDKRKRNEIYQLLNSSLKAQNNNVRKFIFKFYYFEKYLIKKKIDRNKEEDKLNYKIALRFRDLIIEDKYEIEHLISKIPRKKDKEKHEKFKKIKENIGNITLVKTEDNKKLSNKAWEGEGGKREKFIKLGDNCLMNLCEEGEENLIKKEILEPEDIDNKTMQILNSLKDFGFLESWKVTEEEEDLSEV
jgi:hypothetical protein